MAKKRDGVNVSEAVRSYLRDNAGAKPKTAAEEISKQIGKTVSPAYVSQIKNKVKKGGGSPAVRRDRKRRATSLNGAMPVGSLDFLTIEATKTLMRQIGVDNLKRLIDVLA